MRRHNFASFRVIFTAILLNCTVVAFVKAPIAEANGIAIQKDQNWHEEVASSWNYVPEPANLDCQEEGRLKAGNVLVQAFQDGTTKFVLARILIGQPPDAVWPVLTNPFEFAGKICPHIRQVDVLEDRPDTSILRCRANICILIPKITYTVESKYEHDRQIQFRRVGGSIKEFRGSWILRPEDGGKRTEVLYSMYIDPGIPVPEWLVREALKYELPHTLVGLRKRVQAIYAENAQAINQSIVAAGHINRTIPLAVGKSSI